MSNVTEHWKKTCAALGVPSPEDAVVVCAFEDGSRLVLRRGQFEDEIAARLDFIRLWIADMRKNHAEAKLQPATEQGKEDGSK